MYLNASLVLPHKKSLPSGMSSLIAGKSLFSAVLINSSTLQRLPQVAFTCLALWRMFTGLVITQHNIRTSLYIFLASTSFSEKLNVKNVTIFPTC